MDMLYVIFCYVLMTGSCEFSSICTQMLERDKNVHDALRALF